MNYKVTAIEKRKGYRVTVSMPNLTKDQADYMLIEFERNPYFENVKIEKSK